MLTRFWMILALMTAGLGLSGCGLALGAGGAVVADEVAEDDGDDGLF